MDRMWSAYWDKTKRLRDLRYYYYSIDENWSELCELRNLSFISGYMLLFCEFFINCIANSFVESSSQLFFSSRSRLLSIYPSSWWSMINSCTWKSNVSFMDIHIIQVGLFWTIWTIGYSYRCSSLVSQPLRVWFCGFGLIHMWVFSVSTFTI